jgi:excinuclease ABC subunit A
MVDAALGLGEGTKLMILAPLVRGRAGDHQAILERIARDGFVRLRVDGEVQEVKALPPLDPKKAHHLDAVVDRLVIRPDIRSRLAESLETSLRTSGGLATIAHQSPDGWRDIPLSERYACVACDVQLPPLEPRLFSFNLPDGACPTCAGLGRVPEFDESRIVPEPKRALEAGAIAPWRRGRDRLMPLYEKVLARFCRAFAVSPATPFAKLSKRIKDILLQGSDGQAPAEGSAHFEGVIPNLRRRWASTESDAVRSRISRYMVQRICSECRGARLRPEALAVAIGGRNIDELSRMSIDAAAGFFAGQRFADDVRPIAAPIVEEIRRRLQFMIDVGIGYLTLDRTTASLSGGEAQRIRLATQIGSGLVGVCYVLDEPTIGLHQRDTGKLIATLRRLTDMGNTLLVVEHDPEVMAAAEWFVDIGPEAGEGGGRVLVNGPRKELLESDASVTAQYLRGDLRIEAPAKRRPTSKSPALEIKGAAENNLKSIDVRLPLGVFTCITGVSGSGKSSLISQILVPAIRRRLNRSLDEPGRHEDIVGVEHIDKLIVIDQSPLGRSPRSNPATYCGVFGAIRELFAKTREARVRGYGAARFSFNVKGGRCEACQGYGTRRIEMHFLPDVFVPCGECGGTRYSRETLDVRFRGMSIADVLALSVDAAAAAFESFGAIHRTLTAMIDVGLGYMTLGQPAATLSGGEAQRVKLATELGAAAPGHTLYVLDEPTTGLHFADIHRLVEVLNRLCGQGHSIVVIEHNLDVIKQADWIIDLGPEGGDAGGRIVAEGTPEQVARHATSHTAEYLRRAKD